MSSADSSSSQTIKIKPKEGLLSILRRLFIVEEGISVGMGSDPGNMTRYPLNWGLSEHTTENLARITMADIKQSKKIGEGGFGEVLSLDHPDVGTVALKRLRLSRSKEDAADQRRVSAPTREVDR